MCVCVTYLTVLPYRCASLNIFYQTTNTINNISLSLFYFQFIYIYVSVLCICIWLFIYVWEFFSAKCVLSYNTRIDEELYCSN